MGARNSLPPQLAFKAKARSDSALAKVLAHRETLTAEFESGKLNVEDVEALGLAEFCRQAGVGANFLNGDKYRNDVKLEIKSFLKNLKKLTKALSVRETQDYVSATIEDNLEVKFSRLRDQLHEARLSLHAKRKVIRALSSGNRPGVVPISDDKSS